MKTRFTTLIAILTLTSSLSAIDLDSMAKAASDAMTNEEGNIEIPADLTKQFEDLAKSFNWSQFNAGKAAKDVLSALGQGDDSSAVSLLNTLQSAGLNDKQMSLVQDLKLAMDQYVLQRNFASLPEFKGPVKDVMNALKTGNPQSVQGELSSLLKNTSPDKDQKALLTTMLEQYDKFWPKG